MQKAIILGGSKGLGLAKQSFQHNIYPLILARTAGALEGKLPGNYKEIQFDLLRDEDIENIQFDSNINYFVWVAGLFLQAPLLEVTDEALDVMINLHFRNPV